MTLIGLGMIVVPSLSITNNYTFDPKKAVEVKNPAFWTITATCTMNIADAGGDVFTGSASKGDVYLNGAKISGTTSLNVVNG